MGVSLNVLAIVKAEAVNKPPLKMGEGGLDTCHARDTKGVEAAVAPFADNNHSCREHARTYFLYLCLVKFSINKLKKGYGSKTPFVSLS